MKYITDFTNAPIVHLYLPAKELPGILYTYEIQNFAMSAIFTDLQNHPFDGEFLDGATLNLIEEHVIPKLDLTHCTSFPINETDTFYLLPSHRGFGYLITSGSNGLPKALGWYGTTEGYVFDGAGGVHPVIKVPFSLLQSVDKVNQEDGMSNDVKSEKPLKDYTLEIHALETLAMYIEKNLMTIKGQTKTGIISTPFLSKLMSSLKTTHEMSMGVMTKIIDDQRETRTRRSDLRNNRDRDGILYDRKSYDELHYIQSRRPREEQSFVVEKNLEWAQAVLENPSSTDEERAVAEDVLCSTEEHIKSKTNRF